MRVFVSLVGCALVAVLWRAFDDWNDRRKAAAHARAQRIHLTALHAIALEEHAAFEQLARRCEEEAEKQRAHVPIVPPDAKRAA